MLKTSGSTESTTWPEKDGVEVGINKGDDSGNDDGHNNEHSSWCLEQARQQTH